MSQANMEKLSWVLEQLFGSRRIHPNLLTEDAEWVNPHDAVEPGTRRGAANFTGAVASVFATWDDVHFDTDRVIDNGDDVVVLGRLRGHLHESGMEVDSPHGQIWTFRDGRVSRMRWFNTHRETLEAAGLGGVTG
jgi:ketosteroid isomerase-like protein